MSEPPLLFLDYTGLADARLADFAKHLAEAAVAHVERLAALHAIEFAGADCVGIILVLADDSANTGQSRIDRKRTAGADVFVEDLTTQQLQDYRLEGTEETIPPFQQVLDLFDGKAPLIVELKAAGNAAKLTETTCQMLDGYPGTYCLESFDPRCIRWLKKHRPDLIRGQLSRNFFAAKASKLPWYLKFVMATQLINFLVVPDFVAYRFQERKNLGNFLVRKLWGTQGVAWTLRSPQEHEAAVKEGWIPIFEHYEP